MRAVAVAVAVVLTASAAPTLAASLGDPVGPAAGSTVGSTVGSAATSAVRSAVRSAPVHPAVSRGGAAAVDLLGARVDTRDHGPAPTVLRVRAALPALLTRDAAADRVGAGRHPATRALLIETVWDDSAVARRAARTATFAYSDNTFVVTRWQGIQVEGNRATATLRGHQRFVAGSRTWEVADRQWWVELIASGGRWRLLEVEPTDGSDAGCCADDRVDPGADPAVAPPDDGLDIG